MSKQPRGGKAVKLRAKKTIDKNEEYFVHIGFTLVNELKRTKRRNKLKKDVFRPLYTKLKTRPCVQARIDKLVRYWRIAFK